MEISLNIEARTGALTSKGKVLALILASGLHEIETDLRAEIASKVKIGSKVDIIINNKTIYIWQCKRYS